MTSVPSSAVRLFGTEEPVEPPLLLAAGSLTAELEAGNLRFISWDGAEMIRAISFVVRDRNWGTYPAAISDLTVEQDAGGFRVAYQARTADAGQGFAYTAEISCDRAGKLVFACRGRAETPFWTNRTGFVVLHPIDGVAGQPLTLEHADGSIEETRFPLEIDPVQPFRNLRAMTHAFAPGSSVTCRMEGDVYETEDQRNWTDASYKTYVRPLALPWPYEIAKGATVEQKISLLVRPAEGAGRTPAARRSAPAARLVFDDRPRGAAPPLGLTLDPGDHDAAESAASQLRHSGLPHLLCHHDPRRGHDRATLERAVAIAALAGAAPWLEFVVPGVETFEADIAEAGHIAAELGSPFPVVLLSPAADLKSTLPGSVWPSAPPLDAIYSAARRAFPGAAIGGGMFSYFTELNRKRPPLDGLDLVTFSTCPLVHAGDDRSAMETLQAIPHVALSARAIAGAKPFHVGASSIGMRLNPYGDAPKDNPDNIRQAMNGDDPRQRGLFAAAWTLGYFAAFAAGGAASLTLNAMAGRSGIVHAAGPLPRPFFDDPRHAAGPRLYPVFHVMRGLARLAGRPLFSARIDGAAGLSAIAFGSGGSREIWIANGTGADQRVDLSACGGKMLDVAVLDEISFLAATENARLLDELSPFSTATPLALAPYAVARIREQPA